MAVNILPRISYAGVMTGPGALRCCPPLAEASLTEAAARELAEVLRVLADPVRLRLLSLIARADGSEVCACDLVDVVGRSQPTVSHHLRVLADAGLVTRERRGRWVWYAVVPERLHELGAALRL